MKRPPIDELVYKCMFPQPKTTDPQSFQGLLQRQLVPEVRLETQAFYGHLNSQEAKYPGLDYSYQPHRTRLSRFQWHRQLFQAFDTLQLTESEIAGLTKWEGTRWAKQKFEAEQGAVIRDTTADGIEDWVEPELRTAHIQPPRDNDLEIIESLNENPDEAMHTNNEFTEDEEDDSDMEIESVGIELNERLLAAVAQREAGDSSTVMDEEWEQWLKEAVEAGGIPFFSSDLGSASDAQPTVTQSGFGSPVLHPRLLNAARLGQWQQIPNLLHDIARENVETNDSRTSGSAAAQAASATPLSPIRSQFQTRWPRISSSLGGTSATLPSTDSPARGSNTPITRRLIQPLTRTTIPELTRASNTLRSTRTGRPASSR